MGLWGRVPNSPERIRLIIRSSLGIIRNLFSIRTISDIEMASDIEIDSIDETILDIETHPDCEIDLIVGPQSGLLDTLLLEAGWRSWLRDVCYHVEWIRLGSRRYRNENLGCLIYDTFLARLPRSHCPYPIWISQVATECLFFSAWTVPNPESGRSEEQEGEEKRRGMRVCLRVRLCLYVKCCMWNTYISFSIIHYHSYESSYS